MVKNDAIIADRILIQFVEELSTPRISSREDQASEPLTMTEKNMKSKRSIFWTPRLSKLIIMTKLIKKFAMAPPSMAWERLEGLSTALEKKAQKTKSR